MRIGEIIQNYRTKYDISMSDFAKTSGISKPYVSMLEANKNSRDGKKINPSIKTLQKISRAVDIPLNDLFKMRQYEQVINLNTIFNDEERKLLDAYRGLNLEGRTILQGILKSFSNTYPCQ